MAFGIEAKLHHIAADVTKAVMGELDFTSDIKQIVDGIDYSAITTSIDSLTKEIHELVAVNKKLIRIMTETTTKKK